jgi:hypothetical protein
MSPFPKEDDDAVKSITKDSNLPMIVPMGIYIFIQQLIRKINKLLNYFQNTGIIILPSFCGQFFSYLGQAFTSLSFGQFHIDL